MTDELYPKQAPTRKSRAPPSVIDIAARLKVLEQRYANLTRREQLAEQNLLKFEKDLKSELRALQQRILESRRHVSDMRERLDTLQGTVSNTVKRHELKELDVYLDLWKPTEFLTRTEAKKLLEEARKGHNSRRAPEHVPGAVGHEN